MNKAKIVRHYYDNEVPTKKDWFECLIKCYDATDDKYYWGLNWRWSYENIQLRIELQGDNAFAVVDYLFAKIMELKHNGYEIEFLNHKEQ